MRGKSKVNKTNEPKIKARPGRKPMTPEEKEAAAKLRAAEKGKADNLKVEFVLQYQGAEVDMEALAECVSDVSHVDEKRLVTEAEYIEDYKSDNVVSCTENVSKWSKQEKDFRTSIGKNFVLSNVNINSVEHLPVIIDGYFNELIDIDNIQFSINGSDMLDSNEPLYILEDNTGELQFNSNFNNYRFSCSLNLIKYFSKDKAKTTATSKKPTLKQQMLNGIDELVNKKKLKDVIEFKELIEIYNSLVNKRQQLKSNDVCKRIENYVSDYRKKTAGKLTLGRMYQDTYEIVANTKTK